MTSAVRDAHRMRTRWRRSPTANRDLASHGGRRLPRCAGAVLVLRPQGAPRAHAHGPMYTDSLRGDFQSASGRVSLGAGRHWARRKQRPVIVVRADGRASGLAVRSARAIAGNRVARARRGESAITAAIDDFLFHARLPVDIRHNAKIFRETAGGLGREATADQSASGP